MSAPYELRIRPSDNAVNIDWRELWRYRDLLYLMVRRDFVSKYKQTVLGPAWFVFQPLVTTFVFTFVFSGVAKISTDGLPPVLFFMCGMLAWSYFSHTFTGASTTLVGHAPLFGKVYFPRLVVPLSLSISNLFAFGIQLVSFLLIYFYFKEFAFTGSSFGMRWEAVALPLLILHIGALSLGVGLWMSALTAKYRDFTHLSTFLVQIWMYGTPVIYPLSAMPEKWRPWIILNPMTMPVEAFRYIFLGTGLVDVRYFGVSILVTALFLATGLIVFERVERTFIDSV